MGPPSDTNKEWTRADMPSSSSLIEQDAEASSSGHSSHYIEHIVTRLDTLAGVAIKYGVEVADIKRLNGLSTDLQMFALKTLRIPTPGRHPPGSRSESGPSSSHPHSHGHEAGFSNNKASLEKIQETPTMALLRDYYGLPSDDGIEMATISLDNAAATPVPGSRSNPAHARRHSTGDYRMYGYSKTSSESSLLMKPSKEKGEKLPLSSSKEKRPIRRRTRDDSMDATIVLPRREPPRKVDEGPFSGGGGIKSLGAALLGKKEAVEGLLSKVLQPIQTPESGGGGGRPLSERVPSAGSFFEGITSVYRNAKAALD